MVLNSSTYTNRILSFSETIHHLRFPMIVGIVLLHTFIVDYPIGGVVYAPSETFSIAAVVIYVLKADLCEAFVPLFFFISGYLFYYRLPTFGKEIFFKKLKKRFYSLVVPFLLWNIIFMSFVAIIDLVFPWLLSNKDSFLTMSATQILYEGFWTLNQGLIPLWFLRDLIIITLFTLPLYSLLKGRGGLVFVVIMALCYLTGYIHYLPGLGMRCSFPFIFGAWFSVNGKDSVRLFYEYRRYLYLLVALLIFIDSYVNFNYTQIFSLNRFTLISVMLSLPVIFCQLYKKVPMRFHTLLEKGSFFVFVFHMFIIYIPSKLWVHCFPINTFTIILMQIAIPILVSFVCMVFYALLNKMFPHVMNILMGSRS